MIQRQNWLDVRAYLHHMERARQVDPETVKRARGHLRHLLQWADGTPFTNGWSYAFTMQHHGIPTRLLDWTTTFGVALFFAIRGCFEDGAVWVLDPFALNEASHNNGLVPTPSELPMNYYEAFISKEKEIPAKIMAIAPVRLSPRVFDQRAAFTLHTDMNSPLEILYPEVVKKITIPKDLKEEAKEFLQLAGISEYSLFPDLDGLSRDLVSEYFG